MTYTIRKFKAKDAQKISNIIRRNFMEVNIFDYAYDDMKKLCEVYDENKVFALSKNANMYVVLDGKEIVGTGSIASFWGSCEESILLTIFVLPKHHKKGIGRLIMETLENDELFLRSKRIEIPASITAHKFYEKFGYKFKNGLKVLDDEGHYRMEKFRDIK